MRVPSTRITWLVRMRPASGSSSRPARIAVTCAGVCAWPVTTPPFASTSSSAANRIRLITSSSLGSHAHDADARNRFALVDRGHCPHVQHDARFFRARVEDRLADVVGDVADLHPGSYVRTALHQRIEDARLV